MIEKLPYFLLVAGVVVLVGIGYKKFHQEIGSQIYSSTQQITQPDEASLPGINDAELNGLENAIKNTVSGSGAFKFEAKRVSMGKVENKTSSLVKVKYTDPSPHPRQCAYVLYHYDDDAGLLTDIEASMPNFMDGTCSVNRGCFGCSGKTFTQRLQEKNYTGEIKDIGSSP